MIAQRLSHIGPVRSMIRPRERLPMMRRAIGHAAGVAFLVRGWVMATVLVVLGVAKVVMRPLGTLGCQLGDDRTVT